MKKLRLLIPALLIAGILFTSCQQEPTVVEPGNLKLVTIDDTGLGCTPIIAGQNTEVGTICLEDDFVNDELTVTYEVTGNWLITEIHFVVKGTQIEIPITRKGNLIPGQFPYSYSFPTGVTTYSFTVPFSTFGGTTDCNDDASYFAAAHCVVTNGTQTETGWGNGSIRPGNSWGEIFGFKMVCETTTDYEETPETAFAYGCEYATCFNEIPDGEGGYFERWGWSNELNEIGTYYFDIYAAAGQCELTSGTRVGELIVEYDGTQALVTYTTCGNYKMTETHLYVGTDVLFSNNDGFTIAPGQFPYKTTHDNGGVQSFTYGPYIVAAPFYVVAHAVVEGDYTQGSCEEDGCDFVPPATCVAGTIYGTTNDNGDIYSINPNNGGATLFLDISTKTVTPPISPLGGSSPNANAVDKNTNRFYFATFISPGSPANSTTEKSHLYFVDLDDVNKTIVYAGQLDAHASDAAFFNGSYFYIGHGTKTLKEVTFTEAGIIAEEIPRGEITTNFANQYFGFGDIAIDCDGILYLAATVRNQGDVIATYLNAKYDISGSSIVIVNEWTVSSTNFWNQIAFGQDNGVLTLYSHNTGNGNYYKIDSETGSMTLLYTGTITSKKFTDIGSAVGFE